MWRRWRCANREEVPLLDAVHHSLIHLYFHSLAALMPSQTELNREVCRGYPHAVDAMGILGQMDALQINPVEVHEGCVGVQNVLEHIAAHPFAVILHYPGTVKAGRARRRLGAQATENRGRTYHRIGGVH